MVCRRCRSAQHRICADCATPRRRTIPDPGCPDCRSTLSRVCPSCQDTWFDRNGACLRCRLHRRIDLFTANAVPDRLTGLEAFFDHLGHARDPVSSLGWLYRDGVAQRLVTDHLHGRDELTHDVLDAAVLSTVAKRSNAVQHLRHLLIASGVLAERDEHLHRLQTAADRLVAASPASTALVLRQWISWRIIPGVRRRAGTRPCTPGSTTSAMGVIHSIQQFLDWLDRHGSSLEEATPLLVDQWTLGTSRARVQHVAGFLTWAERQRLAPTGSQAWIASVPAAEPGVFVDQEVLFDVARRCLDDDSLKAGHRFAALLVILYAQPLSRICALQITDLRRDDATGVTTLRIGRLPLQLPSPIADIADLACHEVRYQLTGAGIGSGFVDRPKWLFPGLPPTTHIGSAALADQLAQLLPGTVRGVRNTTMMTLARELPSVVLSDLLDVAPSTADRWRRTSSVSAAAYVSARLANQ